MAIVYSELASTQAEQSNGDAPKTGAVPWCTVVSGQIDLNTGGAKVECNETRSDPVEKANPPK